MGKRRNRRKGRKDHKPNKNQNTNHNQKGKTNKMTSYQSNNQQRTVPGSLACDFYMDTDVKNRFDEYARAAKTEIGGLLRVQKNEDGDYVATDMKIFPQKATGATFELDEDAVTKFMMELHREGRDSEMMEWQNIIHSHPNNTRPFLSGVDRPNLISCAGSERWAWSVIMTRKDTITTDGTEYKVHFYQAPGANSQGLGILIQDLPVLLVDRRRKEIEAEVKELIAPPITHYSSRGGWTSGRGGSYGFQATGWDDDSVLPYSRPAPSAVNRPTEAELMAMTEESIPDMAPVEKGMTKAEEEAMTKEIADSVIESFGEMGVSEGAIVRFVPQEWSFAGESAEDIEILKEMADQEFLVEEFDSQGRVVCNGFGFDPDEIELVQTRDGNTLVEADDELTEA